MKNATLGQQFLKEMEMEAPATRKCLERMKTELFDYKPHDKSMKMGYLAQIVAEIPRWLQIVADDGEIDFGTFKRSEPKTAEELVKYFDDNMDLARKSLGIVSDDTLTNKMFELKNKGQLLMSSTRAETVGSSINHIVHHRGQLTVYMRLNDIHVPSIYGPSADDRSW